MVKLRRLLSRIRPLPLPLLALSLSLPHTLLRLPNLVIQLLQPFADPSLRPIWIRIDPPPQPVRRALHQVRQIRLIHPAQRIPQLRRCSRLRRSHLTRRVPYPPLQLLKVVRQLLPVIRQPVALLHPLRHLRPVRRAILIVATLLRRVL
jgi:hypothetical protein